MEQAASPCLSKWPMVEMRTARLIETPKHQRGCTKYPEVPGLELGPETEGSWHIKPFGDAAKRGIEACEQRVAPDAKTCRWRHIELRYTTSRVSLNMPWLPRPAV